MFAEVGDLIGLEIYTDKGIALGIVSDFIIDTASKKVDGLLIEEPNPLLVEHSRPVSVPFRWVDAFGDVILLKYFPRFVATSPIPPRVPVWKKVAEEAMKTAEEAAISTEKKLEEKVKKVGKKIGKRRRRTKF